MSSVLSWVAFAEINVAEATTFIHTKIRERKFCTMKLHTYLNYGGNCEEAFRFYEQHLGGKIIMMMRHEDQPDASNVASDWRKAILYARMTIGETDVMGSDVPPEHFQPMRSVYLSLTVDSTEEAERIHALLSDGGQIFMPMEETFFALRFSMLRDKFGTSWMIIHERPMPSNA
ncbi:MULTISPECIES: VOC family protein [Acidobacteriaceae]|uniref:VOC family protein n=1 Tax=Acidobacteriaceae TaxID=204434 RepID=UPI00131C83A4|nr:MULTISPECIES: VOC family protein [Acidobacteriaceae]MDW5266217.1 VOC family protein [Edaphobacter sp.]